MNLEEQYHAAAMLRIAQSDGQRIAELEAERDNAWTELREIRAAISANPEESTLDEVVKLRQQLAAALAACKQKDESLEAAHNGLRWWMDAFPLHVTEADNEEMLKIVKALAIQSDDSALKDEWRFK